MKTALGQALRDFRRNHGGRKKAYRKFAPFLGIKHFSDLRRFEKGTSIPSHEMLESWARKIYSEDKAKEIVAQWEWLAAMDYGKNRWPEFLDTMKEMGVSTCFEPPA